MNSRHSAARSLAIPTPLGSIKLHLTCYVRQLTAKKRVGEYRPNLPGREHGRAYLRTRIGARLVLHFVAIWFASAPEPVVSIFLAVVIALIAMAIPSPCSP